MLRLTKFKNISEQDLDKIINKHYTHWKQFSDEMDLEDTIYKFKKLYTNDKVLPIGYACYDENTLIGFCTLRTESLKNDFSFLQLVEKDDGSYSKMYYKDLAK